MNAGTVSQLNFGPRHVLQTLAAAAAPAAGGASSDSSAGMQEQREQRHGCWPREDGDGA
jgi:hypothetical protein